MKSNVLLHKISLCTLEEDAGTLLLKIKIILETFLIFAIYFYKRSLEAESFDIWQNA